MRYCSACGHALETRVPTGEDRERLVCPNCGVVHYQNPKVVVGSVCTLGGRVLLCRRAIAPREGFWTIPAGYLELGESTEEGALREAWEEARARIALTGLLAVYNIRRIGQVQVLYKADLLSPDVEAGPESAEVGLFPWDAVPWHDLAFPTVGWILNHASSLRDRPAGFPTVGNPEDEPPSLEGATGV